MWGLGGRRRTAKEDGNAQPLMASGAVPQPDSASGPMGGRGRRPVPLGCAVHTRRNSREQQRRMGKLDGFTMENHRALQLFQLF